MVVLSLDRVTIYPAHGVAWLPEAYEFATDYTEDDAAVGQMQFQDINALVASSYATFSRAGAGVAETTSGELVNFAAGEPRITDRGILIEQAATNVLQRSRSFDHSYWQGYFQKPTFTAGIDDPFGGNGAYRFNASTVTGSGSNDSGGIFGSDSGAYANGDAVTVSIWARSSAPIILNFGVTDGQPRKTAQLTTEWQRYTHTGSFNSTNNRVLQLYIRSNADIDIDLYGAQSEAGLYASSYIDSDSGSATTRPSDELTLTLESAVTSGLFLAEFEAGNGWGLDANSRKIFVSQGPTSAEANLGSTSDQTGTLSAAVKDNAGASLMASNIGVVSGTVRGALRVDSGNHAVFASGLTKVTSASTGTTTLDTIIVGNSDTGEHANTYIKSIALVDPNEWTDTEIQNWVDSV